MASLFIPACGCGLGPLLLVFLVHLVPGGIRVNGGHRLLQFLLCWDAILFVNSFFPDWLTMTVITPEDLYYSAAG